MEIRQKDGSKDRVHTKLSVGASDAALTIDGPIGEKSTFIVSARQSYLQFLFQAIGLPFLPTYNDFQVKYKYEIDKKNEITFIGIGAIDNLTLNTKLQETGTEAQKYLLTYLPIYKQWNYTVGAVYKHFGNGFIDTWVLSRNMLRNNNFKFQDNDETKDKTSDYTSDEAENKLRFERDYPYLPVKLKVGGGIRYSHYTNETYRKLFFNNVVNELNYNTELNLFGYQAFVQASDEYFDNRLKLSLGVNMVGNNFNENMKNPLNQLSPRLSASYLINDKWDFNANIGRYAAQPAYTTMGFRDSTNGPLVNQNEDLKYVISNQLIMGFEYRPMEKMRFTIEGFYKQYEQYPMSVLEGVSIASKGADYGQIGDEKIVSTGKGRAYGVEVLLKIMEWNNLNLTSTYTYFRSEFTDKDEVYRSSSWDTKHLFNFIASYKFGQNWNIATRWRFVGGAPYSPIDAISYNKAAWNITNQPYIDYSRFNENRLTNNHQLDVRIDKEFFFKKWALNLYADVQNVYNFKSQSPPIYTNRDLDGNIIPDPNGDETKQGLRIIEAFGGTILPTIGLIIKI
jgi:outer membrane receptor for ferrienterochelin and colicin